MDVILGQDNQKFIQIVINEYMHKTIYFSCADCKEIVCLLQ